MFGFLRAVEFIIPFLGLFYPLGGRRHICRLALRSTIRVRQKLKQSRTDPFRHRFVSSSHCSGILARRGSSLGPYFVFGTACHSFSRERLVTELRLTLQPSSTQGTASDRSCDVLHCTAAVPGLEDSAIQTLGRWDNEAYKHYILLSPATLAVYSLAWWPSNWELQSSFGGVL